MAHETAGQHPLCTCEPITFAGPAPDVAACRAAAPINPHPVIGSAEIESMRISTRPQDWAESARRILRERGALRP